MEASSLRRVLTIPRRVWFVTSDIERPKDALLRADALARMLDAELSVLQFGQSENLDALYGWCSEVLPSKLPLERLHVANKRRPGAMLPLLRESTPDLIVLPRTDGGTVSRVALSTRIPVLVALAPVERGAVVVGIELRPDGLSVLAEASGLASRLCAPILALHNIPPAGYEGDDDSRASTLRDRARRSLERLRHLAAESTVACEAVVTRRRTAAEAIVLAARARCADTVVVGVRKQSWFARLTSGDPVTTTVIDSCTCSVLVIPLVDGVARPFRAPPTVAPERGA